MELKEVYPLELKSDKPEERMKEIMDRLEQGVQDIFHSGQYQEFLKVMSKFHGYSLNNQLLILMQCPEASLVAGYRAWQTKFERQVKKGEKAIRILAPCPYSYMAEQTVKDQRTGKPKKNPDGSDVKELVEKKILRFKVSSVFDVAQTEGRELPSIGVSELLGNVDGYPLLFEAAKEISPVPVAFEKIAGGAHGYYHRVEKRIAINEGMSELQNIKTLIHEIAHARLHDMDHMNQGNMPNKETREVEAEGIAYVVCQRYMLDTADYSFGYVAGWSSGKETKELRDSLETIQKTAGEIISDMDEKLKLLQQKKEMKEMDSYEIYQIREDGPGKKYLFRSLSEIREGGLKVDLADYRLLYSGRMHKADDLETLFQRFNLDIPDDFTGHSLSVSDIVTRTQNGEKRTYYVDPIGFREIQFDTALEKCREEEKKVRVR